MINLKQFMEVVDYRITEGSDYQWQCFGYNAYCLDSWNGEQDGWSAEAIFDTCTQEVYQMNFCDYSRQRAYRWTNPGYKAAFDAECEDRNSMDLAWELDDGTPVKYVDLDVEGDFLEKARAIVNDENYDTRVQIPVNFTDEELLKYMTMAHERDMTFNQFVEEALRSAIDEIKIRKELDELWPDTVHITNTDNPVDFPVSKKKKKGKK